jgi:leader peptidase (prepilin peptidase)/N-methyltransferase
MAAAAAALGVAASLAFLSLPVSVFAGALAILAMAIAVVDLEHFIIPDLANGLLFALGLALVVTEAWPGAWLPALAEALIRSVVAGGLFLALRFAHARVTGAIGLGLGDVKLAAAGAPLLSWTALPFAVALAAVACLIAVLARAAIRRQPPDRQAELPFGAFLAPAVWLCFLLERGGIFQSLNQ